MSSLCKLREDDLTTSELTCTAESVGVNDVSVRGREPEQLQV